MRVIRVVLYGRVSHDEQRKYGYSIYAQLDRLRAYAEENGYIIVDEFIDDGYSASSTKRPALQEMLKRTKEYDVILFTKLDRFSRNVLDANELVQRLDREKVSIKAVEEDDIDTSTADGMFMFNLKVSLAQRELKKLSERVKSVFKWKIENGQAITGSHPVGFCVKQIEGVKRVCKQDGMQELIEDLFEHFLVHHSITKTMQYINDKYDKDYSFPVIRRILTSPLFAGSYCGNDNYCERYISFKTFAQVQKIVQKNLKEKISHTYLFTSLIICPCCQNNLSGVMIRGKHRYKCNACIRNKYSDDRFTKTVSEAAIEDYVLQSIDNEIQNYIYKAKVKRPKTDIEKRVKEIHGEMARLNHIFKKKRISEEVYDREYDELEIELSKLKSYEQEKDYSHLEKFLNSNWKNTYSLLNKENKRALLRSVIDNIYIDGSSQVKKVSILS